MVLIVLLEFGSQRQKKAMAEHDSIHKKLNTESPPAIETYVCDVYTSIVFCDVQKEIMSSCLKYL